MLGKNHHNRIAIATGLTASIAAITASTFIFHILYIADAAPAYANLFTKAKVGIVHTVGVAGGIVLVSRAVDGEWCSLTPRRAVLAPLAISVIAFVTFQFFNADTMYYNQYFMRVGIQGALHAVAYSYAGVCIVGAAFLTIGCALKRDDKQITAVVGTLTLVTALYMEETSVLHLYLLRVAMVGLPQIIIGFIFSKCRVKK